MLSNTIKNLLTHMEQDVDRIPLPAIDTATLQLIVTWMQHHEGDDSTAPTSGRRLHLAAAVVGGGGGPSSESDCTDSDDDDDATEHHRGAAVDISAWDREFLPRDKNQLFKLLNVANFLDMRPLLDIGTKFVSDQIKGKPVEWVRDYLNMLNDFTPEEEAKLREEIAWADGL